MKVHEAIIEVMKEVGAVKKGDRNDFHKFHFRGIDATVNALSPALRKHGVTVRPSNIISCTYEKFQTAKGGISLTCRLLVEFTFVGPEGDSITSVVAAEAADTGDKSTPKAMSVAFRTALLQTFALPTDEVDPDAHSYEHQPAKPSAEQVIAAANGTKTKTEARRVYKEAQAAGIGEDVLAKIVEIAGGKADE